MKLKQISVLIFSLTFLCCIFKIESQSQENITFEYCGIPNPTIPNDCFIYDTPDNSCCYYQYRTDISGCISLGTRFKGGSQYGALSVFCSSYINKLAIWSLVLVILILI